MNIKLIIFDFDGTLADTLETVTQITNRLAKEFGYKPSNPKEISQIRNLSSVEIIKQSGISFFQLPFLLKKLKVEMKQEINQIDPFPGMRETLIELRHQGNHLGIVTSNSQENVKIFLKNHQLDDCFDFIHSETSIFGKSKVLKKVLKQAELTSEEVIYVGDETRDIEAAKREKIQAIAVSWGFNSEEILSQHQPDFLIHNSHELIEVVKSLQKIAS